MKEWPHYVDLLKGAEALAERAAHPDHERLKAELWRQFAMNL